MGWSSEKPFWLIALASPRCRSNATTLTSTLSAAAASGICETRIGLLVADVGGELAAFARAGRWEPPGDSPDGTAPAGWYLFGVVVRDRWRRLGIGIELTRQRLAWIGDRAEAAYYFANARNVTSIDLHRKLGFDEVTRDFTFPGASFEGGAGILFRVDLRAPG
jgi:GNAT superfamily N-acetyltransferase